MVVGGGLEGQCSMCVIVGGGAIAEIGKERFRDVLVNSLHGISSFKMA